VRCFDDCVDSRDHREGLLAWSQLTSIGDANSARSNRDCHLIRLHSVMHTAGHGVALAGS
jgi:hypothetical protein